MNEMERAARLFEARKFTNSHGESINYRLLRPLGFKPDRRYPLVVYMHGAGEIGDDNLRQLEHGVRVFATEPIRAAYRAFVVAPQCPSGDKWVNTEWSLPSHRQAEQPTRALRLAHELVLSLLDELPIDRDRIYLMGNSMGGFAAWEMAARWPELWACVVPFCGGGDETQAPRMAHLPIWAFHGALDALVIPERSRNMIEAIRKAGGRPRYTEYEFVEHFAWVPALQDGQVIRWMFEQSRT